MEKKEQFFISLCTEFISAKDFARRAEKHFDEKGKDTFKKIAERGEKSLRAPLLASAGIAADDEKGNAILENVEDALGASLGEQELDRATLEQFGGVLANALLKIAKEGRKL